MIKQNLFLYIAVFFGILFIFNSLFFEEPTNNEIPYNQFIQQVERGEIEKVTIQNNHISAENRQGDLFKTYVPSSGDQHLTDLLIEKNVELNSKEPEQISTLATVLLRLIPLIIIIIFFVVVFKMLQSKSSGGGSSNPFSMGKSKAKLVSPDELKTTFKDVAGNKEAIEEVKEVVDFLKEPEKYWRIGAQIPHGVLMLGPPGTGKTLLAKAVAGEANVPFYSISGSDFVEMFVGVGASRVRDMFKEARENAPCIIFVDEIDALGRSRSGGSSSGGGGGNDEREQTLNQLLVEMDGFTARDAVIVIAATNRGDVLDPALLRPGRFDRQVTANLPDVKGRADIIKVHLREKNIAPDVSADNIAKSTPMFSGAELANLTNEAALTAARRGSEVIAMKDFESAKDKIIMGPAKQGHVMKDKEKRNTAYHESGHAIVSWVVGDENDSHDPVYKVSILPRGRALGVTMYLPEEDKYSLSYNEAYSQICSLYAGRIAEEMTLEDGGVTTGASNDIERATEMAYNMVARWGYSQKLGARLYAVKESGHGFSGNPQRPIAEKTQALIDEEVARITSECYERAKIILENNKENLEIMMKALMEYETIDRSQIETIMKENRYPEPPQIWQQD